jgi:hypothetical protein
LINLYFRSQPQKFKWIPGDRYIISIFRNLFRDKRTSGIEKVFVNLCKGFDVLNIAHSINRPFKKIGPNEPVVILGSGRYALEGYKQPNPVIAGIGLMTHPSEWPALFKEYPVAKYLQHSEWTNNIYADYYGKDNCDLWHAGIDTDHWQPNENIPKTIDILIYNKIMWDKKNTDMNLRQPILNKLDWLGLTCKEIIYGQYTEPQYFDLLQQSRAMIFLCEHESQGFACCEALSVNVPVFAWDQGFWLDPNRLKWNDPVIKATSIPFFDEHCGMSFKDIMGFENGINSFWNKVRAGNFSPRTYILENLTLKKSAERMMEIIGSVYK